MSKSSIDTTQTQQRYKSTTKKTRAAWRELGNAMHQGPWVDPSKLGFREEDLSKVVGDDYVFHTAVRKESDPTKDMAQQWAEPCDSDEEWGDPTSYSAVHSVA